MSCASLVRTALSVVIRICTLRSDTDCSGSRGSAGSTGRPSLPTDPPDPAPPGPAALLDLRAFRNHRKPPTSSASRTTHRIQVLLLELAAPPTVHDGAPAEADGVPLEPMAVA